MSLLLYSLEVGGAEPAFVVADADVGPFAEGLADGDLGALVNGEEVGSGAVGRGLGIDDALRDDGFVAEGVTAMERRGIESGDEREKQGYPGRMEGSLAEPGFTS